MDKAKKRYSRSIRRDDRESADYSPEREVGRRGGRDGGSKLRGSDHYHHERSHEGSKDKEARSKRKDREEEREGNKKPRVCGGERRRRRRLEDVAMEFDKNNAQVSEGRSVLTASETSSQIFQAVKRAQELAAQMQFRQFSILSNLCPRQAPTETAVAVAQKPTKAPVLRVDALGREVDEHGHVISVTKPSDLSTLKVNINKHKKDAFQILQPEVDPQENPYFDPRMGHIARNKILRPKRISFQFVEQGKWTRDAENLKLKCLFGEAKARELKVKQAHLTKANDGINPNLIELSERVLRKDKPKEEPIPDDHVEWWDQNILMLNGTITERHLKMEKLTHYIEHPRPIEPLAEAASPPPQPLKLTKKEQKKLRTQRRVAKEKEKQEMIRQGLLEPPKAKVKMSNLMKILASEATQDPTKLEKEIRAAAAEREQAHTDRNAARKLTPAEKREKKVKKLNRRNRPTTC